MVVSALTNSAAGSHSERSLLKLSRYLSKNRWLGPSADDGFPRRKPNRIGGHAQGVAHDLELGLTPATSPRLVSGQFVLADPGGPRV